jgi:type 1 fimbriae regulatory protein FimB/type 1 fimbriae regulatory protein FimE
MRTETPEASGGAIVRTPTAVNGTVPAVVGRSPPRREPNKARRAREYLTPAEVEQLMQAARARGRYGARDAGMILVAYRHGLRVAELVTLRWDQVDLGEGLVHVQRVKRGTPSVHPLRGPELRLLRALQRVHGSGYVFMTERGAPMTPAGFRKLLARTGRAAGLGFPVHPHMLRHGCGFKLANDGHDTRAIQHYLGHRNIAHTVRYTELSPQRFREFWND